MHDWSCVRNIEESVGLLLGQDFVDAVIDLLPFFNVKGPTPFNEQPVDFGVLVPNEIVFSLFRLARMPYVVEVRIPAHAPPKDDSLEGAFVYLLQERLPFHLPDAHLDAYSLQVLLA